MEEPFRLGDSGNLIHILNRESLYFDSWRLEKYSPLRFMNDHSFTQKLRLKLAGPFYAFLYFTAHRRFIGATLASWIKLASMLLVFVTLLRGLPLGWTLAALALTFIIFMLYRAGKRAGYIGFMADSDQTLPDRGPTIADEEKIALEATGPFSVKDRESFVLLRPAKFWRVPNADHALMVEEQPGQYLYQFIKPGTLQEIESGYLLFGRRPRPALRVSFLTTWGPEFAEESITLYSPNSNDEKMRRKIYLAFDSDINRQSVWRSILRDAGKPVTRAL